MSAPVYNPIVPFNMGVSLSPGFMIIVSGVPTGNRFSVNLKTGPGPHDDIALHFNPRFDEGFIVVRNTRRGGRWETEERQASGFPFAMGQPFELIFLCQPHQFKVAVNGRHFIEFPHRLGFQRIQYLAVDGAVKLNLIRFDQEAAKSQLPKLINNPAIPYTAAVPFNNIKNRKLTISGIPENRHPHRMQIDFKAANQDIFLHFNPRFNNQVIVRNSLLRGSWGKEERQLGVPFPFQYGVPYMLVFAVDQNSIRVELNGMLICTYNHRQRPLNLIREVQISGSTAVNRIAFE